MSWVVVPLLRGDDIVSGFSETLAHLQQHPEVQRRHLRPGTTDVQVPDRAARGAPSPSVGTTRKFGKEHRAGKRYSLMGGNSNLELGAKT